MLYRLAMGTGFRANELRSLTPRSFNLDGDPPTVTVKAGCSKHRREDVQPIRSELANALRPWVASKPSGRPVFGKLTQHTAEMLRVDLEAAGLPYEDASGRVADFHCLRHSYITALAKSNAPVRIIQSLARHSTPTLTLGIYAHVGLFDQSAALDALPDLTRQDPRPPAAQKTGTDDALVSRLDSALTAQGQRAGDGTRRLASVPDVMTGSDSQSSMEGETLGNKASDASRRLGTRTDEIGTSVAPFADKAEFTFVSRRSQLDHLG
jgi:hypothetical protein